MMRQGACIYWLFWLTWKKNTDKLKHFLRKRSFQEEMNSFGTTALLV